MYTERFGFSEFPFSLNSDERFFYANQSYQQAFIGVRYGIKLREGLIVVTGEPGIGKTSLLAVVKDRCEPNIHLAVISNPRREFSELLRQITHDLGLPESPADGRAINEDLRRFLLEHLVKDHIAAVIIDEAQDLDLATLRELESLLELKSAHKSLLQVVLLGRPELEKKLDASELRQFKQGVARWYRLEPLTGVEVGAYIDHRLAAAGYAGKGLFQPDAVEQIALYSKGIPGRINVICDDALFEAYRASLDVISAKTIKKVSRNLKSMEAAEAGPMPLSSPSRDDSQRIKAGLQGGKPEMNEEHFPLEGSMMGAKRKHNPRRWIITVAMLLLAATAVMLYRGRSEIPGAKPHGSIDLPQQTSEQIRPKEPEEPRIEERVDEKPAAEIATSPGSSASRENDQVETIIFVHASRERDRSIVDEIGGALRTSGYSTRATRMARGRTEGDVRFFFPRDRRDAETVKSLVESELGRRGYRLSLKLLQRDGRKFEFAAPGKIEVWLPPLPASRASQRRG